MDDESIAENRRLLGAQWYWVSTWISRVLHAALLAQKPTLGVAGEGRWAENGQAADGWDIPIARGDVHPRSRVDLSALRFEGSGATQELGVLRESNTR